MCCGRCLEVYNICIRPKTKQNTTTQKSEIAGTLDGGTSSRPSGATALGVCVLQIKAFFFSGSHMQSLGPSSTVDAPHLAEGFCFVFVYFILFYFFAPLHSFLWLDWRERVCVCVGGGG